MRKFFLSMAAVAALLTSCSKDETTTAPVIERSKVTFTVNAPELSTRADEGKGLSATKLEYVIYDLAESPENGANQIYGTADFSDNSDGDDNPLTTTVEVDLVEGRTYDAIFFAHAEDAPYTFNKTAQTMTINTQGLTANNEKYDAFYKYVPEFEITDKQYSVDVEMKRPFAQLNVATVDYDDATNYPAGAMIDAATTGVKVKAYKTMDLKTGNVDKTSKTDFEFALASADILKASDKITVGSTDYTWLSMNYILVNERETVDVEFSFTDVKANGYPETYTRTYTQVPVERNFRTNIVGTILTSPTDFKVTIDPDFVTPNIDWDVDKVVTNTSSSFDEMSVSIEEFMNSITDTNTDNDPAPGTYIFKIEDMVASNYAPAKLQGSVTRSGSNNPVINIHQKEGYNFIIDGSGTEFAGQFIIHGHARSTGAETLTFTNIKFTTDQAGHYFIDSNSTASAERYAHNVFVEDCTFTATDAAVDSAVAMHIRQGFNISVVNSIATNMHSLMQLYGNTGVIVDGVTVKGKNGIALGTSTNAVVKNSDITAKGYGIRADGVTTTLAIENNTIDAPKPIIVRKLVEGKYSVALNGNNDLTTTEKFHIVFTNGDDDAEYVAPTGAYEITGADNFSVFPRDIEKPVIATTAEQLTAFLADKDINEILLAGNVFEGTFNVNRSVTIKTSEDANTKATIKGRVNISSNGSGASFENINFCVNEDSKVKKTFSGSTYNYPAIVVIYAAAATFEGCDFEADWDTSVCSINYGAHAAGKMLTINNCTFTGDFYAIRTRTLFNITNSKFDIYTSKGTLAAVWTWGNGPANTDESGGANSVTFTGNTNLRDSEIYSVQMMSSNFNYAHININIQDNDGFKKLEDCINSTRNYTGCTFAEGSETFEF